MKVIVYSTKKVEKDLLMKAANGRHELTWESASLNDDTVRYAAGHQAVIVFVTDQVSCSVVAKLAALGVNFIISRSAGTDHIDFKAAANHKIQVKNVPAYSPHAVAEQAVALALALSRHLLEAAHNCSIYNFSLNTLTGFNLYGKTVGIIGLGNIGKAAANIFNGFGCQILGYDTNPIAVDRAIKHAGLNDLLVSSNIIPLHVPLNEANTHMINTETISRMKTGAMLINTARGALVNTHDILAALDTKKLGYYGTDVYEFERGIFLEDHEADEIRDPLLTRLIKHPQVLLTPHQAFLTMEALKDTATYTMQGLSEWETEATELLTNK